MLPQRPRQRGLGGIRATRDRGGSLDDLRRKLLQIADPELSMEMGRRAWHRYETAYTPEQNLAALLAIYRDAADQLAA